MRPEILLFFTCLIPMLVLAGSGLIFRIHTRRRLNHQIRAWQEYHHHQTRHSTALWQRYCRKQNQNR